MSLMPDNWIRQMSSPPTHIFEKANGVTEYISKPFSTSQQKIYDETLDIDTFSSIVPNKPLPFSPIYTTLYGTIREMEEEDKFRSREGMIVPFIPESVKICKAGQKAASFGLSSYGYDVRLTEDIRIFTNVNSQIVDPYDLKEECYVKANIRSDENGRRHAILPPNSFLLGHTVEWFNIPEDVTVLAIGKSTWARAGVAVTITPLEAGFKGEIVIEVANLTNLPVKIYTGVGIAQFLFIQSEDRCNVSYDDRKGKYQLQRGVTLPKV